MVVALADFRNLPSREERHHMASQVLRSLLQDGIPLPLFAKFFEPCA